MLQIAFRYMLVLGVLCPYGAAGQACSYAITGLIEDTKGERLIGATVQITSLQKGSATDVNGNFIIDGLCPGQYHLLVRYVGFEDQVVVTKVPSTRSLIIKLNTSSRVLHDVVIEGNHLQHHSLSQAVGMLSGEEMAASKGKPLGEMVQQIPGVQTIMTGSNIFKPVIHGLHGQRIAILNNGLRQEGQQWGVEHAPEIDTYNASEIEVVKGAEAVRFGADALGGAIIINPEPLHFTKSFGASLHGGVTSNNRGGMFSAMVETGLGKDAFWSWRLQGTIKRSGDFHAPAYNLSNTGSSEYDASATIGFRKGKKELEAYFSSFNSTIGILRSAHTGSLSDLQQSIVMEQPWFEKPFTYSIGNPRQQVGHHLIKISARMPHGKYFASKAVYGLQFNSRKEFDVRRGNENIPSLSLNAYTQTLDLNLDHDKRSWSGTLGLNGSIKDNFNEGGAGLLPDYQQQGIGLYLIEKFRWKKWLFEGGVRADHQKLAVWLYDQTVLMRPEISFDYLAATLGLSVHASESIRITSNVSQSRRPPHVSELFSSGLHHSAASIERGLLVNNGPFSVSEDMIQNERSTQWVTTLQFNRRSIFLEWSGFANYFRNFVYLTPSASELTIRGYFPVFTYQQTDALLAGSDVMISADISKHLKFSSKFSYVRAEDRKDGERLPLIPPARMDNSLTYHKSALGKWKSLYATLTAQTTFRQTRAPQTVYPEDVETTSPSQAFDFMPAPSGYTLLRLDVGIKLPLDNRDLGVSISAENLLDTSYRNYMNRLRYYADDIGRNISLRINYTLHSH